jgi:hypothetical protein
MDINGIYRNLNSRKSNAGSDLWSISNAHIASTGYLVVDKGVTHNVNFSVSNPITNNPASITKGCQRITRPGGNREVVAIIGGNVSDDKPTGECIGRLTLDLQAGQFQVITDNGRIPFDTQGVTLWFGSEGCSVYK